jgi:hypothetical protein
MTGHLLTTSWRCVGDEKSCRVTGAASDGELWASKVFLEIVDLARNGKYVVRLGLTEKEARKELALMDRTLEVMEILKTVCAKLDY